MVTEKGGFGKQSAHWNAESLDRTKSLDVLRQRDYNCANSLNALHDIDESEWTTATLSSVLDHQVTRLDWKRGELLMPLRIAISGREATPSLFETLELLGKAATLRRLEAVIDGLG